MQTSQSNSEGSLQSAFDLDLEKSKSDSKFIRESEIPGAPDFSPMLDALAAKSLEKRQKPVKLTENALKVLRARYLKKDESGKIIETPEEMFERVAHEVAGAEAKVKGKTSQQVKEMERKFYDLMVSGCFMPNSPTLMNAGREMGLLSACFVLPVDDSIDGIFASIRHAALIQKAGGGTGFNFSHLRPAGDRVKSSGGTTSGPLSFIRVFSEATGAIQQGAFRRGANMGIMSVEHPDIIDFILLKEDHTQLTNFNLSVGITDSFIDKYSHEPNSAHNVTNPRSGKTQPLKKKGKEDEFWTVKEIFDLIVEKAWKAGEPGIVFLDRIQQGNPTPHQGVIEATNPCGEQPLLAYEACNLGSIDVSKFVVDRDKKPFFDYKSLKDTVHLATRFLDDVVDVNNYPLSEIRKICLGNRKIGLGIMGFSDALYKMNVAYNSEEAVQFGEELMEFINNESHNASEMLAGEKGSFPNWKGSIWEKEFNRPMRNAAATTVAPTGTVSIIANCSGGIEPLFSLVFFRNVLNGTKMIEVNEVFRKKAAEYKVDLSESLLEEIAEKGTLKGIDGIPDELKRIFVCAHDIDPEDHIRMQIAFQKHCDASISKTINFPADVNKDRVESIFRMAFESNLKGVTVYRDGCRDLQPMALVKKEKKEKNRVLPLQAQVLPIKLPEIMPCLRIRQMSPFGNMHVKISVDPKTGVEREVFAQLGRGGDIANSDLEAICRITSLFLRSNGSLKQVLLQLSGIGSSLTIPSKDGQVMSLADGLAKAIMKYLDAKEEFGLENLLLGRVNLDELGQNGRKNNTSPDVSSDVVTFKIKCPECQSHLRFMEGCVKCESCGFSQC
jgi:ribonucleoside-diphosphate reductase alpha chain